MKSYRQNLLERIFSTSASLCPEIFTDFTVRGEGKEVIEWNQNMLIDQGTPVSQLRDLTVMLENTKELRRLS